MRMHSAYRASPVIEKLPLQIESIAAYDDNLLVGTKQGHILVYRIFPQPNSPEKLCKVELIRSNKSFAKKPINQLTVIPDFHIVISLSDNQISVHDLNVLNIPIAVLARTKGATLFVTNFKKEKTQTGDVSCMLRLCVSVKKKLQLYYWKNRAFLDLSEDLNVPDIPKVIGWCGESLCVGFRNEYCILKTNGEQKDLFPTGKMLEPRVIRLADDKFALGRDEATILVDVDGIPTHKYPITWSEIPICMEHDPPYVVSVVSKGVEVRTIEPRLRIQNIDLNKPRLMTLSGKGRIFVASISHIWCLISEPVSQQIPELLQDNQFELALKLADVADDEDGEKQQRMQQIRNLYAFSLFCKLQFKESLEIFHDLETDPSHVIGLFPDLLPQVYREQFQYPGPVPQLSGADLENGLLALIDYLTQTRHSLSGDVNRNVHSTAIVEGSTTVQSKKQLLQIIDTTILKCFLQTNDALVASLLRLPDNHCHIEESERALKKYHKYSELIILYQRKNLHRKALDLLLSQAKKLDSPLKGHERTIQYLQHLGRENLDLIFDFCGWVLKAHPSDGLRIFTEYLPEVQDLPRDQVLNFLLKTEKSLVLPYLEHVIYTWKDTNSNFHNVLVYQYREKLQSLSVEIASYHADDSATPLLTKRKDFNILREKLQSFLNTSVYYTPEQIIIRFPYDDFFEERAILMGRIGRHEQALAIYADVLKDKERAEEYCRIHYNPDREGNKDVYLILLKLYAMPSDTSLVGVTTQPLAKRGPDIDAVLKLINEHPEQIDPIKALDIIPGSVALKDVCSYLEHVVKKKATLKRNSQIKMSLHHADYLQVQQLKIYHQADKIIVTEFSNCFACKKRIGNSAFARYPNEDIVHYFCRDKYQASIARLRSQHTSALAYLQKVLSTFKFPLDSLTLKLIELLSLPVGYLITL